MHFSQKRISSRKCWLNRNEAVVESMLRALKKGKDIDLNNRTNPLFLSKLRERFNKDADLDNLQVSEHFEKDRKAKSRDPTYKLLQPNFSQKMFSSNKGKNNKGNGSKRTDFKRYANPKQSLKHQSQLINQINKRWVISGFEDQT